MILILIYLLAAHAVCDYPLQGDFLSKAKNRTTPIPGVPWQQALLSHALIHAGAVALITHIWPLAIAEFIIHAFTDDAKCRGYITFNQDQAVHIFFKFIWFFIYLGFHS